MRPKKNKKYEVKVVMGCGNGIPFTHLLDLFHDWEHFASSKTEDIIYFRREI